MVSNHETGLIFPYLLYFYTTNTRFPIQYIVMDASLSRKHHIFVDETVTAVSVCVYISPLVGSKWFENTCQNTWP